MIGRSKKCALVIDMCVGQLEWSNIPVSFDRRNCIYELRTESGVNFVSASQA